MSAVSPVDRPFTTEEYRARVARVQAAARRRGIDAMFVSIPENNYWLTGFRTLGYFYYMVLLVPVEGDPIHLARYVEKNVIDGTSWTGRAEYWDDSEDYLDATARIFGKYRLDRATVSFDKGAWYFTFTEFEGLQRRLPHTNWVDGTGIIERLRLIKSPAEQAYTRQAAKILSGGMQAAIRSIRPGLTENDVMATAYDYLLRHGSEVVAEPPMILTGVHGSMAHAAPEGVTIRTGDVVYHEIGASVKRYHAAMMRTAFVGDPPKEVIDRVDLCRRAIEAGLEHMQPGNPAQEVDRAVRKVMVDGGCGDLFRHKAGYSLGAAFPPDWSEAQTFQLREGEVEPLQPGMIFHILPTVFDYPKHGLGVSDTVLITEHGHEVLTEGDNHLYVIR
ncbi:MAG TPA: Xaa-Pro peptidase family protein [bacterium]|nr:Xaa-Pro peptidase family protein [bacterium]